MIRTATAIEVLNFYKSNGYGIRIDKDGSVRILAKGGEWIDCQPIGEYQMQNGKLGLWGDQS